MKKEEIGLIADVEKERNDNSKMIGLVKLRNICDVNSDVGERGRM